MGTYIAIGLSVILAGYILFKLYKSSFYNLLGRPSMNTYYQNKIDKLEGDLAKYKTDLLHLKAFSVRLIKNISYSNKEASDKIKSFVGVSEVAIKRSEEIIKELTEHFIAVRSVLVTSERIKIVLDLGSFSIDGNGEVEATGAWLLTVAKISGT